MKRTRVFHLDESSRADSLLNTVFGNHGTISKEDDLTQNWILHYFVVDCQGLEKSEMFHISTLVTVKVTFFGVYSPQSA